MQQGRTCDSHRRTSSCRHAVQECQSTQSPEIPSRRQLPDILDTPKFVLNTRAPTTHSLHRGRSPDVGASRPQLEIDPQSRLRLLEERAARELVNALDAVGKVLPNNRPPVRQREVTARKQDIPDGLPGPQCYCTRVHESHPAQQRGPSISTPMIYTPPALITTLAVGDAWLR